MLSYYRNMMIFCHKACCNSCAVQAKWNASSGMHTPSYKIQPFDAFGKIWMTQKSGHFTIAAGSIQAAHVAAGSAFNGSWVEDGLGFDEWFNICV